MERRARRKEDGGAMPKHTEDEADMLVPKLLEQGSPEVLGCCSHCRALLAMVVVEVSIEASRHFVCP